MTYDIIIVGAGPAGLTAAIYSLRAKKSVLIIEKGALGGQMTFSPKIENYPGFIELSGNELADKMTEQALSLGAEIEIGSVIKIKDNGKTKTVLTEDNEFEARTVILAVGAEHRRLGVKNEEELIGNGVSFCAVCDAAFFNNQSVCLAGGGNSAMQEALLLSENCKKVTMIQNLAFLTGEETLKEKIAAKNNIEIIYNSVVTGLLSDSSLTGVEIENTETKEKRIVNADGLFVAVGLKPDTEPFKDIITLDDFGYINADESCLTNIPGIFTAGDCRKKSVRQVSTAVSDGASAAIAAVKFIG
ncbi:MAG: FAD-dependent oxidoreductase [Oscillospiraceae bacterium]|nr:FAD-dependent oxidoreductase [Oscillospiraceae bacterium]